MSGHSSSLGADLGLQASCPTNLLRLAGSPVLGLLRPHVYLAVSLQKKHNTVLTHVSNLHAGCMNMCALSHNLITVE